jgi:uncharacterized protein YndB with AHSA1/START domain
MEVHMTRDRIEREVLIAAPIERVWAVLTERQHIAAWFGPGDGASRPAEQLTAIDLRPGGVMVLDHGEYGTFPTRIERVEPPDFFSYRWASAYPGEPATDDNSTLVEFRLTADGAQTRLTVTESGFAFLVIPPAREATAGFDSHSDGWTGVLKAFAAHAEQH